MAALSFSKTGSTIGGISDGSLMSMIRIAVRTPRSGRKYAASGLSCFLQGSVLESLVAGFHWNSDFDHRSHGFLLRIIHIGN
jgi:hypothetical protein